MISLLVALSFWISALPAEVRAPFAHWTLETDLNSAVGGAPLEVTPPRAARFETVTLDGGETRVVLRLSKGAQVLVPTGLRPLGQGFIGAWTLVVDMRIGEKTTGFACGVLQTDRDNDDAAEIYAHSHRGVGFERRYYDGLTRAVWHRLVFVADRHANTASVYVDGDLVTSVNRPIGDSHYTLEPDLLLLADRSLKCPEVDLAGVHVRAEALGPDAVAALGTAESASFHALAGAPSLTSWHVTALDGAPIAKGATLESRAALIAQWQSGSPAGKVSIRAIPIDSARDAEPLVLGYAATATGSAIVRIPTIRADTYRLDVAIAATSQRSHSPIPKPDKMSDISPEGFELVANGGFEGEPRGPGATIARKGGLPEHWLVAGEARLARIGQGFHLAGGAGPWRAEQVLELPDTVSTLGQLAGATNLLIGADMRREQRAGRFDDRGWIEATFEDRDGAVLGSLRTLHVESQGWARREAHAPLPEGAVRIRLAVHADHRRGGVNSIRVDNISARLVPNVAVGALGLRKRPIVHATEDSTRHSVVFETVGAALRPIVRWGPGDEPSQTAILTATTVNDTHQIWRATLTPLTPGAVHTYTVSLGATRLGPYHFRAPAPEPTARDATPKLRVAWMADNQYGWETFTRLLPIIAKHEPELMILAGDIVQNGDERREWQTEWYTPLATEEFGQSVPIQFARGNHDGEHALSYAYTDLPGNGAWFAYTRAGVRFIFLNTEAEPDKVYQQVEWLKRELQSPESRDATFRIAVMHKPPYANRWDSPKSRYDGERSVRENFVPLFHHNDVDLVVAGHAHCYQRRDFLGVRYVVVGGGGGRLDKYPSASWPMTVDWVGHHYAILDVDGRTLTWEARSIDGEVIDAFTLDSKTDAETSAKRP